MFIPGFPLDSYFDLSFSYGGTGVRAKDPSGTKSEDVFSLDETQAH